MWWGTAIEAPDPSGLARFYSDLLGWPIGHEEPGTAILAAPQGSIYIVFQQAEDYRAPVWPPVENGIIVSNIGISRCWPRPDLSRQCTAASSDTAACSPTPRSLKIVVTQRAEHVSRP